MNFEECDNQSKRAENLYSVTRKIMAESVKKELNETSPKKIITGLKNTEEHYKNLKLMFQSHFKRNQQIKQIEKQLEIDIKFNSRGVMVDEDKFFILNVNKNSIVF